MENERLARVEEKCSRIPIIEEKLDRLLAFKYKALGVAMAALFLANTIIEFLRK